MISGARLPTLFTLAALGFGVCTAGCNAKTDPRFESARATVSTLLRSHALDKTSLDKINEVELAGYMRGGAKIALANEADFHGCFADYRTAADEGLAGFVLGRLAPKKDSLIFTQKGDRTEVRIRNTPSQEPAAVLVEKDGAWRFSLKDSVPAELRQRLLDLYQRTEAMHRSQGGARLSK